MAGSVCIWSCCWCRDSSGNYTSTGMTTQIVNCPACTHIRCSDCPVEWVKLRSSTSSSNLRSSRAPKSTVQGVDRGVEDNESHAQQSDSIPGSTIDSTTNAALLQDARISDSADFSPYLIPPGPNEPKPQEGEVENFDIDQDMDDTTKKSAQSSAAEEIDSKGSGNPSLK
ncbi:hypothetical protein BOTCAL_0715g00030 [Botryotinia calthae]|uniref:Uncharacterized protein n=1 Tax=Botryotinia calthae TaxID=38488 RepID=A0A4Y8CHB3_9HELO|nr:hypothetical protein BOTCAL_0715g00030 [Botryotinia calthae]